MTTTPKDLADASTKALTLDGLMALRMPRAAGERRVTIRISNPGGLTAHQTVEVASANFGFDWEGQQLVLTPAEPLAALSAQDLEDLRKSARKGQSWHAYQAYKKHADEKAALKAKLDALKAENEALRKDAERYRLWRKEYAGYDAAHEEQFSELLAALADCWSEPDIDAAIDEFLGSAAVAQKEPT